MLDITKKEMIYQDKSIEVLKFWHKLEFFMPFDLDEVLSNDNKTFCIYHSHLENPNKCILPWLSESALKLAGGSPPYRYEYNLYLLPFDKNELTRISNQAFPYGKKFIKSTLFEEDLKKAGKTCFAKLKIDSKGSPYLDKMAFSTLPWAMGRLINRELDKLDYSHYKEEKGKLETQLSLLNSHLENFESELVTDKVFKGVLNTQGLHFLFALFQSWAGFSPTDPLCAVVEMIKLPPIKKKDKNPLTKNKNQVLLPSEVEEEMEVNDAVNEPDQKPEECSILNSFYIEDLEKVLNSISFQKQSSIHQYINGIPEDRKIDLYDQNHNFYIKEKLHPNYSNHGKWPTENNHLMSLMQQFSINNVFSSQERTSLFSVNGPPGTGKTTLLQEIIAENITRRAEILSEYSSADDVFSRTIEIRFPGGDSKSVKVLDKKLTGFEMVVVSSNNKAVENISKEFPLKNKLANKYKDSFRYLTPVSCKVFAEHVDNEVKPLKEIDKPWGLLSAALGNSKNRSNFHRKLFFSLDKDDNAEKERVKIGEYLTIWEWKKTYKGPAFFEARSSFIKAKKRVTGYFENIKQFIALDGSLREIDLSTYYEEENKSLEKLIRKKKLLTNKNNKLSEFLFKLNDDKNNAKENLGFQLKLKPNFIHTLFRTKIAKQYELNLFLHEKKWNEIIEKELRVKKVISKLQGAINKKSNHILLIEERINEKKRCYEKLSFEHNHALSLLPEIILPPKNDNIEDEAVQLKAFWQNPALNELRSDLFLAALTLHEAWLADVLKSSIFTDTLWAISYLLENKRPINKGTELYIWQNLFMCVPVISTTFASIANQFKNLEAQSLGWFLIDEAGQATPQSAIGALWRAKRALVVGDPLQIEPVYTIPENLVEGLAEHSLSSNYTQWLPTHGSVQTLADAANYCGAYIHQNKKSRWIGSPLRVHRRCLEPMFSVSNKIAYDNKMIQARVLSSDMSQLPESCWYNVKGTAIKKQFVLEQGDFVLQLITKEYIQNGQLPSWYIITPFRQVKASLQQLIGKLDNWKRYLPTSMQAPPGLYRWCNRNIGTVHTFQGKEAKAVILVLGADENSEGTANWASSTPNLLNVAVTRAQDRIYVIGDYELWSSMSYFSDLAQKLLIKDS